MKMKSIKVLIFLMIASFFSYAQIDSKYVKQADDIYDFGAKADAQQLYLLAIEENPNNIKANFMVGLIYIETIHKPRAIKYFLKAYEIDAGFNPYSEIGLTEDMKSSLLYYIGRAYHYGHDFDNAIQYYKRYKSNLNQDLTSKKISQEIYNDEVKYIDKKVEECNNGKEFVANPEDVTIENIGDQINSPFRDNVPVVSADEKVLVFTSRRPGGMNDDVDNDNMFYEDVYISHKEGDNWGPAQNIGDVINSETHDATSSLSPDGSVLYVYNDEKNGTLWSSTFEEESNGEWGSLKLLPQLKSRSSQETHVTSTQDGNKMIFVSDREGGQGSFDLWMVEKDDKGKWGDPINLGDKINTEYEERGPFILADGSALYFSSKGHKTMGEYEYF